MVRSKAGIEFENELALDIYRETDGSLVPIASRSSGNVSIPMPDLIIDDGETVHAMEIKRTSNDKVTFESEPDDELPTDDCYQLLLFAQLYPRRVQVYFGAKFPRRQLVMTRLWPETMSEGTKTLDEILDQAVTMCPVESKNTRTSNFIVYKPTTDQWPSATKGDDVQHVLDTIGYTSSGR